MGKRKLQTKDGKWVKRNSGKLLHLLISKKAYDLLMEDLKNAPKKNVTGKIQQCIISTFSLDNKTHRDKIQQLIKLNKGLYNQVNASVSNLRQVQNSLNSSDYFNFENIQKNPARAGRLTNAIAGADEEIRKLRTIVIEMLIALSSQGEKTRWVQTKEKMLRVEKEPKEAPKTQSGKRLNIIISKEANELLEKAMEESQKSNITEKIEEAIISFYAIGHQNEIDGVYRLTILNKEVFVETTNLSNDLNNIAHSFNIFEIFDPQSIKDDTERIEKLISILENVTEKFKKLRILLLELLIRVSSQKERDKWLQAKENFIKKLMELDEEVKQ